MLTYHILSTIINYKKEKNVLKDRIKTLRKVLDLTQQEFADKLGIKRNTVATYETGKSNPSDAAVLLICKTFNINEEWLRTGKGEMFKEIQPDSEYMKAARDICSNNDEAAMKAVVSYWKMDPEFKKIFWDKLLEVAEIYKSQLTNAESEEAITMESIKSTKKSPLTESEIDTENDINTNKAMVEESSTIEPLTVDDAVAEFIKSRLEIVQQERSSVSSTTAEKGRNRAVNQ